MDCIRSASTEALEWAKAICQDEGANVPLESDNEDEARKVTFSIYSVSYEIDLYKDIISNCIICRKIIFVSCFAVQQQDKRK